MVSRHDIPRTRATERVPKARRRIAVLTAAATIVSGTALVGIAVPAYAGAATSSSASHGTTNTTPDSGAGTVLAAVITKSNGMSLVTVTDPQYAQYFAGGDAAAGVRAIVAAGAYSINGFAIPATADELLAASPDGYTVNGTPWLHVTDGQWYGGNGGSTADASYADAAFDTATAIPAGLEIRLLDTDGDGLTDAISADYKEGLIADKITRHRDGTYSIVRADLDAQYASEHVYDGAHFSSTSGEVIPAANFDSSIRSGDVVLFWYGPSGWSVQRPFEAKGTFVDGADHSFYQIGGVAYADAMRFSRDNIIISNRPGEYTNAQKYFGLINDPRHSVSLWLVPTSTKGVYGAPIAFTSGDNASYFLSKAVDAAKQKLAGASVSATWLDVRSGSQWVTQAVHDELAAAVTRAQGVLRSRAAADLMDYQTYLLYLNLHGTADDIGARFAGFDIVGFDNQVQTAPASQAQTITVSSDAKSVASARHQQRQTSPVAVTGAKTKVAYTELSDSSRLKIDARTGVITVKAGTAAGAYTITVGVTAAAGTVRGIAYDAATATATITVNVR